MISRRSAVLAAITIIFIFAICHNPNVLPRICSASQPSLPLIDANPRVPSPKTGPQTDATVTDSATSPLSPHVLNYFDQAFSVHEPAEHHFHALHQQCESTKWVEDDVYLQCGGMAAGLTSIMSQVKVCLKMAVEAGTGIVLPSMPLRDSTDLKEFNFFNNDAYMTYDRWFDADHLAKQFARACPRLKIVHPEELDSPTVAVRDRWNIDIGAAPGYQQFQSYFWTGRPFKAFFDEQYARLKQLASLSPERDESKKGITVLTIDSNFLLFRITDDPTGRDLKLWNDLSHLIRFTEPARRIVSQLLAHINRPFYGIHFRVEDDAIWSSLDNQLRVDLDALDSAWAKYGQAGAQKPLVYLACGDREQVQKFVAAGKERGWEVTHKWLLAQSNGDALEMINDLPFDFQGAVDMGVMLKSVFFLGLTGSAFSSTIANARDVTGRYRGSSFSVEDDGNAKTHLFNDLDASHYACCL